MTVVSDVWNILKDRSEWKAMNEAIAKIPALEARIAALEAKLGSQASGYVCDHCGSPALTRIGNRPDPTFGTVGVKQEVFRCEACSKESAFTPSDKR